MNELENIKDDIQNIAEAILLFKFTSSISDAESSLKKSTLFAFFISSWILIIYSP